MVMRFGVNVSQLAHIEITLFEVTIYDFTNYISLSMSSEGSTRSHKDDVFLSVE